MSSTHSPDQPTDATHEDPRGLQYHTAVPTPAGQEQHDGDPVAEDPALRQDLLSLPSKEMLAVPGACSHPLERAPLQIYLFCAIPPYFILGPETCKTLCDEILLFSSVTKLTMQNITTAVLNTT